MVRGLLGTLLVCGTFGFVSVCSAQTPSPSAVNVRVVTDQAEASWIGAFGEGFAMLAAAGGPAIHPHAVSSPEERARWDKDVRPGQSVPLNCKAYHLHTTGKGMREIVLIENFR